MNKRYVVVTTVVAGLLTAILCGIKSNEKPLVVSDALDGFSDATRVIDTAWVADPFDSTYAQAIVPQLLDRILTDGDWYPDTLCKVKGMPVIIAWDGADRSVIYSQGRVLADDPAMFYADIDLGPFTKIIQVGDKKLTIDFSDTASVNKLTRLSTTVLPGFKRCRMRRQEDVTDKISVVSDFEVDVPTASVPNGSNLNRWLNDIALATISGPDTLLVSPHFAAYYWKNRSKYQGPIDDRVAVYDYMASYFMNDAKPHIENDGDWWERRYYSSLSLRAKYSNGRFVTYQMATNMTLNGAHGYYTVQMVSYDPIHSRPIDWNYIFKPGSVGQVVRILERIAEADPEYMSWNANIYRYTYHKDEEWYDAEETFLPNPALTDEGVVFSYQPYEIACFAAGMYHFTIPYSQLQDFLTDEAKWCLGIE